MPLSITRFAALCCLPLLVTGCLSVPGTRQQPAPVETAPGQVETPASKPVPGAPWKTLLEDAATASARGDYGQALALLERAQRIDPGSALIYLELARTYQAAGNIAQARATAERGLLYCDSERICNSLRAYLP